MTGVGCHLSPVPTPAAERETARGGLGFPTWVIRPWGAREPETSFSGLGTGWVPLRVLRCDSEGSSATGGSHPPLVPWWRERPREPRYRLLRMQPGEARVSPHRVPR